MVGESLRAGWEWEAEWELRLEWEDADVENAMTGRIHILGV